MNMKYFGGPRHGTQTPLTSETIPLLVRVPQEERKENGIYRIFMDESTKETVAYLWLKLSGSI